MLEIEIFDSLEGYLRLLILIFPSSDLKQPLMLEFISVALQIKPYDNTCFYFATNLITNNKVFLAFKVDVQIHTFSFDKKLCRISMSLVS